MTTGVFRIKHPAQTREIEVDLGYDLSDRLELSNISVSRMEDFGVGSVCVTHWHVEGLWHF